MQLRSQHSAGPSLLLRCTTLSNEPNLLINMSPWEGPVGYLPQEKTRQANKQDALLICWLMQGTLLQSICLGCVLSTIPCVVVSIRHYVHLKRTKYYRTLVEKGFWTPNSRQIFHYNNCNWIKFVSKHFFPRLCIFKLASVHVLGPHQSLIENSHFPKLTGYFWANKLELKWAGLVWRHSLFA